MPATVHAPRGRCQILERRNCLAEVVERGDGVPVERPHVNHLHLDRGFVALAKNTLRHRS